MLRRFVLLTALAAGVIAVCAVPAMAKELRVDDDHAQCPTATFTSIQAAVTAAAPGDKIKVCDGTYTEQVRITNKDKLKLEAEKKQQAVIKFPPATTPPNALVHIDSSDDVDIRGFTITGPYTSGGCVGGALTHVGVFVDNSKGAKITDNHITLIQDSNPALYGCQDGLGVLVGRNSLASAGTADLDHNLIDEYQKGGVVVDGPGSEADVDHNVVRASQNPLITVITAPNGIQVSRGAEAKVDHNEVSGNKYTPMTTAGTGILLFEAETGGVKVDHNEVFDNDLGIEADSMSGGVIEHNDVYQSTFDGISLCGDSTFGCAPATDFTIRDNDVFENAGSGIALYAANDNQLKGNKVEDNGAAGGDTTDGIRLDSNSTGNSVEDNHMKNNVDHDCHDDSTGTGTAGTANTWKGNKGATQNRPGLCKP